MKICIVCGQIAGFGRIGGFGTMARKIAEALEHANENVSVCVLRTANLRAKQFIGQIPVIAPRASAFFFGSKIFNEFDADIFHSQEPTLGTYRMQLSHPNAKHVVTSIDPRDDADWKEEFLKFSLKKKVLYPFIRGFEDCARVRNAVSNADHVICQTKFIIPKVMRLYSRTETPTFIGNAVSFPEAPPDKASKPTVCFLARFDKRKRPELFFEMAKKFPNVNFIAIGKAHDPVWDKELRNRYSNLSNVQMLGYINPFTSNKIDEVLSKSWILINTATREGLPSAFVEALSHKCAILATNNPDDFAENFGFFAEQPENLKNGLEFLLENNKWRELGERGYEFALENFEENEVAKKHIELYEKL